jgi:hypothetical protein
MRIRSMSATRRDPVRAVELVAGIFADDLHALRVLSLANGAVGVLRAATLSVHAIGRGYAQASGGHDKHGVKQVDRLLSNSGLDVWSLFEPWVRFVVGERTELVVALDWTEFDADDHATLAAHLITNHGRATPLLWLTVPKTTLAGQRNDHEYRVIERLHGCVAPNVRITLLADRGFGDQKLYRFLDTLGWDYVIRFRGNIVVTDAHGAARAATEWLPPTGRATMLRDACVTDDRAQVAAVVVVHDKKMKESWCLATSRRSDTARAIVKLYGRRFTIEETFRDTKNLRFGLGLSATHIRSAARRDRLLLLAAISHALLTLLGAAGEAAGLDRTLKSNTSAKRTLSLFNQGCQWYAKIPNMPDDRLATLMEAFDVVVRDHAFFRKIFGII